MICSDLQLTISQLSQQVVLLFICRAATVRRKDRQRDMLPQPVMRNTLRPGDFGVTLWRRMWAL